MSQVDEILNSLEVSTHEHDVIDTDKTFTIDPFTRNIIADSGQKTIIIQGDHNSERFTFTMPRYIEGHDMALCNLIYVPYINSEPEGRNARFKTGVYPVNDLTIVPDKDKVTFSWLISGNATKYEGNTTFSVLFSCVTGKRVDYRWSTNFYEELYVLKSLDSELSFENEYVEVIEAWKEAVKAEFAEFIDIKVQEYVSIAKEELNQSLTDYLNSHIEIFNNKINTFDEILRTEITKMDNDIDVLKARMDTFTSLPEGSTAGDAELADIRVGANDKTYDSAGTAVREQFNEVNENVDYTCSREKIEFIEGGNIKLAYDIGTVVDLTPEDVSWYRYAIVDCVENDIFLINATGGGNPRLWGFLDDNNILLSVAAASITGNDLELRAPKNAAKIVINDTSKNANCYKISGRVIENEGYVHKIVKSLSVTEKITFIDGKNIKLAYDIGSVVDLTPEIVSNYRYAIVECTDGDSFIINGTSGENPRLWAFLDENDKLLSVANTGEAGVNLELRAPKNAAKIIVNDSSKTANSYVTRLINAETLKGFGTTEIDMITGYNITLAVGIGNTVNLTPNAVSSYEYAIIPCEEGDVFTINGVGGENPRLWGFVNEDNILISVAASSLDVSNLILVTPANASKLIVNNITSSNRCSYMGIPSTAIGKMHTKLSDCLEEDFTIQSIGEDHILSTIRGLSWSDELADKITDFEKDGDLMVHVSTFTIINQIVYMTYYANTRSTGEVAEEHTARFVYCSLDDPNNKTFIDLQDVGETYDDKTVDAIYDTILMRKDDNTLYLMWTAKLDGMYYRLYRTFDISTGELSDIQKNYFKVGDITNEFSISGMTSAFAENNIKHKPMTIDIGIMQKLSSRIEDGVTYYYTGCYANNFNCIIKSSDLITWEFVAMPDFDNASQFENAVYVLGDKVYYFVRQEWNYNNGFLTYYDLVNGTWHRPVYINDCQSRSDFFYYNGELYLIHAPKDRNHLEIIWINTTYLAHSSVYQTAYVANSFYPYVLVYDDKFYISFTVGRKHIRLCTFTLSEISANTVLNKLKQLFL